MKFFTSLPRRLLPALSLIAALCSVPARAEWFQLSSTNFVIYGEGSERSMRKFTDQLERYHDALGLLTGRVDEVPSPSNRLTIYLVSDQERVRELLGGEKKARHIGGFYIPRAGASVAVVPRITGSADDTSDPSMAILLHEYAHHLLISGSDFTLPRWANEGGAEFFASASFASDGAVMVGRPNARRGGELAFAMDVTATDLLDPESYEKRRGKSTAYDAFYGKSWALYHYLALDPARKGQLSAYYRALAAGQSIREAGISAFGNFAVLEKELDSYLKRRRLLSIRVDPAALDPGDVTVRRLTGGEIAIMPVRVQSWSGVNKEQAVALVVKARAIAARHSGDAAVLAALAEAEFDAGNDAEALAAANAAIKLDSSLINAHVQKGFALFRMAKKSRDPKAFRALRNAWVTLNGIEPNHPLPLVYFYRSYVIQGREPSALAIAGLARAAELAPFDLLLRMDLAMCQLRDGKREEARRNLLPIAYNPHSGFLNLSLGRAARRMIERMEREPDWRGQDEPDAGPDEGAEAEPPA